MGAWRWWTGTRRTTTSRVLEEQGRVVDTMASRPAWVGLVIACSRVGSIGIWAPPPQKKESACVGLLEECIDSHTPKHS